MGEGTMSDHEALCRGEITAREYVRRVDARVEARWRAENEPEGVLEFDPAYVDPGSRALGIAILWCVFVALVVGGVVWAVFG